MPIALPADNTMSGLMNRRRSMMTTNWSIVQQACGDTTEPRCRAALEQLCEAYWYPLYVYLRRTGHDGNDAEDLVQSFFAALLEKHYLRDADARRGRFRAFLLTALKHHVSGQRQRESAQKRGGALRRLSIDTSTASERWAFEPADERTAEVAFDRDWALELLRRVLQSIDEELQQQGRGAWFENFRCFLVPGQSQPDYGEIADRLGMTRTAVKVTIHRLRQTYRRRLEAEIAATVDHPDEIGLERAELLRALESK